MFYRFNVLLDTLILFVFYITWTILFYLPTRSTRWNVNSCTSILQRQKSFRTTLDRCVIFGFYFFAFKERNTCGLSRSCRNQIFTIPTAFPFGKRSNTYAGLRHCIWHACHYLTLHARSTAPDLDGYNIYLV